MSGYDLIKTFRISMVHYWHAHQSQIYPTLERMARRGLVRRRTAGRRGGRSKRLYSITQRGERVLVRWLRSPFEAMKVKQASLLRLRFLGRLGIEGARARLLEERATWRRYLAEFRALERRFFGRGRRYRDVNSMFTYFTLRSGITAMQRNVAFCDWALAVLARNRNLFLNRRRTSGRARPRFARVMRRTRSESEAGARH